MITKLYCAAGYKCNNNCLICVVDAFSNQHKNMTTKQVLQLFEKIKQEKHLREIEFSGGEPTVRDDFLYLLNWLSIKHPYLSYSVLTNGRKFCNLNFAKEFSRYNIRHVITALHHYKEEKHDEQTQAIGSFKQTFLGIKNLSFLGINLTVKIIVTKLNYKAMPQMIEFVAKNFPLVKNMSINGLDIRGRAEQFKDKVAVSFTKYIPYVNKAIDIAKKYNINIVLYSIPLCVLSEKYRTYAGAQPDLISVYKSPVAKVFNKTEKHGHIAKCEKCDLNKNCYGTWFSYFDVFGTKELKQTITNTKGTIIFDVCGICNNDCIFCSEKGSNPSKEESLEKLKKKINLLKLKKNNSIDLMGGEPTLYKELIPLIKYISKYTNNISMTTNSRMLSNEKFAKKLISSGISYFSIDLHAPNAQLHDKITQRKGSFRQTIKGIENLINNNCVVSIKVIMHKMNYKYLKKIAEFSYKNFSKKLPITYCFISINGSAKKNKKKLLIKASKIAPYLDSAIDFCKSKKINIGIDMFPICVLKNYKKIVSLRGNIFHLDKKKEVEEIANNSICKICDFYKTKCDGVWGNYIKEFGISEFNPQ